MSQHSDMFDLHHLGCITVSGLDALAFCQSQLVSDLRSLEPGQWHPSAWCNAQGKVKATCLIRIQDDTCAWVLPASQLAHIRQDLSRFMIGRKVELSEPQLARGLWGRQPMNALSFDAARQLHITESAPDHSSVAEGQSEAVDDWRLADLRAGLPWLTSQVSEQFLPQELGLGRLGVISYRKGCYPGQEVIAKLHYRGQVKKRPVMIPLASTQTPPLPGAPLFTTGPTASGSQTRRPLGLVIESAGGLTLAIVSHRVKTKQPLWTTESVDAIGQALDLP